MRSDRVCWRSSADFSRVRCEQHAFENSFHTIGSVIRCPRHRAAHWPAWIRSCGSGCRDETRADPVTTRSAIPDRGRWGPRCRMAARRDRGIHRSRSVRRRRWARRRSKPSWSRDRSHAARARRGVGQETGMLHRACLVEHGPHRCTSVLRTPRIQERQDTALVREAGQRCRIRQDHAICSTSRPIR
jgi:hypothetical protein